MNSYRNVLITGAAGGIGRTIAAGFAALGDRVVVADKSDELAAEVAAEVGATSLAFDLMDTRATAAAVTEAAETCGGFDVLVNNAGLLTVHGSVMELSPEDYEQILRVNVLGTYVVTQAAARHMVSTGRGGCIVNISSVGARQPTPGMGGYESSKAAIEALTRWAAIELSAHGIRVNSVAPGPVLTPGLAAAMPPGSEARRAWEDRIPLRTMATADDVAAAVVFLAGGSARHITGASLPVDGGQLLL